MRFQARHSNILSIPKESRVRDKIDPNEWNAQDIKYITAKRNSVIEKHGRNNKFGYSTIQHDENRN